MFRFFKLAALGLFAAWAWAPLSAQESGFNCLEGSDRVLSLSHWEASIEEVAAVKFVKVDLTLTNSLTQGVRMIQGAAYFADILGRDIAGAVLDNDLRIDGSGSATQFGAFAIGPTNERLLKVQASDVRTLVCVTAVVLDDGTVQRFGTDSEPME